MAEPQDQKPATAKTHWLKSRTLWTCVAVASLSFDPFIQASLKDHPTLFLCAMSAVFAVLRVITIGGIGK